MAPAQTWELEDLALSLHLLIIKFGSVLNLEG